MENYLVRALVDFDDVSDDNHSDLLYDLAGQMVTHLKTYLKDASEVANVLQYHHRQLAEFIHAQMQQHHWEKVTGHDVVISKGFTSPNRWLSLPQLMNRFTISACRWRTSQKLRR